MQYSVNLQNPRCNNKDNNCDVYVLDFTGFLELRNYDLAYAASLQICRYAFEVINWRKSSCKVLTEQMNWHFFRLWIKSFVTVLTVYWHCYEAFARNLSPIFYKFLGYTFLPSADLFSSKYFDETSMHLSIRVIRPTHLILLKYKQ